MNNEQVKIGIVTIDDYANYGNRLQNYALTKLLKDEGYDVINGIRVYSKEDWVNNTNSYLKRIVKKFIPFCFVKKYLDNTNNSLSGLIEIRKERFASFVNSYTKTIEPIVVASSVQAFSILQSNYNFSAFVTGSDQVWNPHYEGKGYEFLSFAPYDMSYSFAASIGVDSIPQNKISRYKEYLNGIKYICVREQQAADIVNALTGRQVDVVLDPTLFLEKGKWELVAKKPEVDIDDEYICTYFLGEIPKAVDVFAKQKGLKVYAMNSKENEELFIIDPAEFLYMIKNAKYVLTDSFHAVAFSIIFNKEFYVFDRREAGVQNMFSRIETITKRFGLENRIQDRSGVIEQPIITKWSFIEEELRYEKDRSFGKFLKEMGI